MTLTHGQCHTDKEYHLDIPTEWTFAYPGYSIIMTYIIVGYSVHRRKVRTSRFPCYLD